MAWITSNDPELLESITRHEGNKDTIYALVEQGKLPIAEGCNFDHCKASGLWPAYLDSEGLPTVGVGHLITDKEGFNCYAGLSDDLVMEQLSTDVITHLSAAKRLAKNLEMNVDDNQVVQRFMTEMCFNIGAGAYKKFRNGLKKLTSAVNGDGKFNFNDAADEHLDSRWARQVGQRAIEMTNTLRELDN